MFINDLDPQSPITLESSSDRAQGSPEDRAALVGMGSCALPHCPQPTPRRQHLRCPTWRLCGTLKQRQNGAHPELGSRGAVVCRWRWISEVVTSACRVSNGNDSDQNQTRLLLGFRHCWWSTPETGGKRPLHPWMCDVTRKHLPILQAHVSYRRQDRVPSLRREQSPELWGSLVTPSLPSGFSCPDPVDAGKGFRWRKEPGLLSQTVVGSVWPGESTKPLWASLSLSVKWREYSPGKEGVNVACRPATKALGHRSSSLRLPERVLRSVTFPPDY